MKERFVIYAVLLCMLLPALGGTAVAQNPRTGTSAAPELLIPVGGRDLAMSGSSLAISQGVEAIYWNPAGLGRMTHATEGMFSSMKYLGDINVNYGAVGTKFGEFGVLGLTIKALDFGDIPLTTVDDPENRSGATFSPTFVTLGLTYSREVTDAASVGISAKLVSETISRVSASTIAFDFGLQYSGLLGLHGFELGVTVKNIGPEMKFDGTGLLRSAIATDGNRPVQQYKSEAAGFELPSMIEIGASYRGKFDDERMQYNVSGSYTNNNLYLDEYRLGGEYGISLEPLKLYARAGYNFVPQVQSKSDNIFGVTLGFGVDYQAGSLDIMLDYAYRQVEYFDNNNVISVRLGF
jgi:hypothetical protein